MSHCHLQILTVLWLLILVPASNTNAQLQTEVIARALFPNVSDDINVMSFHFEGRFTTEEADLPVGSDARTLAFSEPLDMFGIEDRNDRPTTFVLDDSIGDIPNDAMGIIKLSDTGNFFGVVDPVNGNNSRAISAVWTIDISEAVGGLTMSIDLAAMGDFNSSIDSFLFETSIDGSSFTAPLDILIDESTSQAYTLQDGDVFILDDPMVVDTPSEEPVVLDNNFRNFTVPLQGSGDELTLRFTVFAESNKAFVFRNIVIEGLTSNGATGDYNGDGAVNLADYTVWRDSLGMSVENGAGADGSGNGVIDTDDYDVWKTQLGQSSGQLAGLSASVPEPASAAVALLALGFVARSRRSTMPA